MKESIIKVSQPCVVKRGREKKGRTLQSPMLAATSSASIRHSQCQHNESISHIRSHNRTSELGQ